MRFSLIGMSGTGKTYWSKKFAAKGFKVLCCDDLLEKKLGTGFKSLGYCGLKDVAKWMGQPYEKQYAKNSQEYLTCEEETMKDILAKAQTYRNMIIDTTGSVIYLGKAVLKKLCSLSKMIYIRTDPSHNEKIYRLYFKNPKPVIWGKTFQRRTSESNKQALARCYPKLLEFRAKEYEKLADITLDYNLLQRPDFSVEKFLEAIS